MRAFFMALQIGADSIALSPDGSALLYGPLSGASLYLIPTSALPPGRPRPEPGGPDLRAQADDRRNRHRP